MKPQAQTLENGALLLRYQLPQTIFTSSVYPIQSPNGSSIIICGHENGIYILWRGGRPLKQHVEQKAATNGGGADIMIIDSDDDEPAAASVDKPEFEADEDEYDSTEPYPAMVQDLDLPLGTAVLDLAFPRMPPPSHRAARTALPAMMEEKLILGAACADGAIRIIQLPLLPPSYHSKQRQALQADVSLAYAGRGSWGERVLTLPNPTAQQSIVTGISMAFAAQAVSRSTEKADEDADETLDASGEARKKWDLIVASHASERVGKLFVYKIAVSHDETWFAEALPHDLLWHSQTLPAPATSVRLFVDTDAASWRAPRVLVSLLHGPVRIFECGTAEDVDQGTWTTALYPGFTPTTSSISQQRKILDAQFVLGGKGVAVILADGEWGVWDCGTSSRPTTASIPTKFTLRGSVNAGSFASGPSATAGPRNARTRLFPMTPGTRKMKQEALFSDLSAQKHESHLGGICVTVSRSVGSKADVESLLIWHGEKICRVASLTALPSASKGAGKTSNAAHPSQELAPPIDLGGDLRNSVAVLSPGASTSPFSKPMPDLLISAMRSLAILSQPLAPPPKHAGRITQSLQPLPMADLDRKLLTEGLHGLDGLDRMLDALGNRANGRATT